MLAGGFRRIFLVQVLNHQLELSVRNGNHLLVPVEAYLKGNYMPLYSNVKESKSGEDFLLPIRSN